MKYKSGTRRKAVEYEKAIADWWREKHIFQKSVELRDPANSYVFYDGPPFITGQPHHGTLLSSVVKDTVARYWTMKGYRVERRWGWDCHGLPAENFTEKHLGGTVSRTAKPGVLELKTGDENSEITLEKYIETARELMVENSDEWKPVVDRVGRWVDMEHPYRTMDKDFMESVWWAFKRLYDAGKIYEGEKVLMYDTKFGTPVSKAEVTMDNDAYRTVTDPSVYVKFKMIPGQIPPMHPDWVVHENTYLLAWTTTPWTLPANAALAVNPDMQYWEVKIGDEILVIAKDLVDKVLVDDKKQSLKYEIFFDDVYGRDLVGLKYEPLMKNTDDKSAYKIYAADYVEADAGTGIVHIAPAYGEEDFALGKKNGVPVVHTIDDNGFYFKETSDELSKIFEKTLGENYEEILQKAEVKTSDDGRYEVWSSNKMIAKALNKAGIVWKIQTIQHEYPFNPRSGGRIMYRAVPSWFMNIDGQKKEMLAENENVNWFPAHIKEGRFRKNIEQAPDWNLSRNRFWATALPVWKGDKGTIKVVGSYDELYELSGVRLDDYHRPWVDEVEFDIDGEHFHRVEEVVDGWFESGSMPFAQFHYPFENREKFEKNFPGDFITEYIGQTRAWFYYVHAVGVALSSVGAFGGVSIRQFSMSDGEREMEFLRELAKDGDWHSPANPEDLKNLKSFKKWLKIIDDEAHGRNLREGRAPAKMYWIEKNGEIVGTGSVRLKLSTPILAELGGHIGWGLLKKYRGQGIMTKASGLLIAEARKSGLGDLMITATEDNVASRKIIEKNGGILDKIAETPFRKGVKSAFYTIPKNVQPEICAATNAFKNVIVTGTLAGNDGLKMSKSRGNYTDPMELLDQYSADAYRLTLLGSPVCAGEDFALTDKDVSDTNRKLAMIWNVYDFFTMYASVDGWEFQPEKPLLALDIDDVLAATIPGAFEYFSKKLGRPAPSLDDFTEDWAKLMGVDEKTAADLMKEIYADDEFFGSVDEVAGAKKALEKLHNKFKIVAVTSRPPSMEKITRAWIQKNFAGLFDEVYMMNFFDEISADAAKKTKGEFVKKLGARWLIDDQPKHCNSAIENGVKAICFGDYPWSKTGLNDGILRADDWEKVEEILQSDVVNPLPKLQPDDVENPLDKWIISRAHQLLDEVSVGIEKYDLPEAVSPILPFVDDLSNWYVRRSRRRFWKNENDDDKNFAYATLHYTLLLLSQIIAPFCPFIAEELYHNLTGDEGGSVHLLDWPDGGEKDEQVLADMARTRKLIELGLALRMDKNSEGGQIKIRQPLSRATYAGAKLSDDYEQIIAEELNVKTVTYVADIKKYVSANYFDDAKILEQVRDANADVSGWLEISKRLTPELKAEGLAREIIRAVQNARKAAGLNVDDRIELTLKTGDETLRNAIETWRDTIMKETLALKLTPDQPRQYEIEKSIDGALVAIGLSKIEN